MFYLRYAVKNLTSNARFTLMSILACTCAFLLFDTLLLSWANAKSAMRHYGKGLAVTAYLSGNLTPDEETAVINAAKALPGVASVVYESKKEAVRDLAKTFDLNGPMMEGFDIVTPSIRISLVESARTVAVAENVAKSVAKISGVEDVQSGIKWMAKYAAFSTLIETLAFTICIILVLAVIVTVSTTLKLNFSSRSEEISVLGFIGASPTFIRVPVYMEGILQAFIGALIAWGLATFLAFALGDEMVALLNPFVPSLTRLETLGWNYFLTMIGMAVMAGIAGSRLALKKVKI